MLNIRANKPGKLSTWKKVLFSSISCVVFFAAIELLLTVCGVRPVLYDDDPYVGFASNVKLFVRERRPDGSEWMVRAENKADFFNAQEFPARKGDSTFRIFCVGGSTTYGRPFGDNSSFPGWLRELLPAINSSKQWEVINAGGISYASYRVALLMEELIEYDPDLFIVYSGHNEFLERRTYDGIIATPSPVRGLAAQAGRTRTFSLMRRLVRRGPRQGDLSGEVETILDQSVGPEEYRRDDELREQVLGHYRFNLARMADIAQAAGARVVFVTPASNLRDCSPFKSEYAKELTAGDVDRWNSLLRAAKGLYEGGNFESALATLHEAGKIDARHANVYFLEGRMLDKLGRFPEARQAYQRSRDEDICPLRALTQISTIVKEVAEMKGVDIVDFAAAVASRAENGVPGKKQFLDHVHPTIEEHLELAASIVDVLCSTKGPLSTTCVWMEAEQRVAIVDAAKRRIEARIDQEASGLAMMNLSKVMSWAGKNDDAYMAAKRAVSLAPNVPEVHYQFASSAQRLARVEEALAHYRRVLDFAGALALPEHVGTLNNLGVIHAGRGELQVATTYYRRAIELDPEFAEGYYNLGFAYTQQEKIEEASAMFREILRIHPDHAKANFQFASLLAQEGDFKTAIHHLERVLRVRPADPSVQLTLAMVYVKSGRFADAEESWRKALQLAQSQGNTALVREITAQLKQYQESREATPRR
ncbi:MAG: tetratricopeptide repeat protein [Kiritimatiellia bacterium]|jgi:tetratricopeptide (TPR) repeat protein|nr:tetratricopeptide repeat protein [Kiritimatiellia bacterium]